MVAADHCRDLTQRLPADLPPISRQVLAGQRGPKVGVAPPHLGQDAPLEGRWNLPVRGPPPQPMHYAPVPIHPHPSQQTPQVVIEMWRVAYNTKRPHSALGYRPPAPAACSH